MMMMETKQKYANAVLSQSKYKNNNIFLKYNFQWHYTV